MKLTKDGIKDTSLWEAKGYSLPQFDREKTAKATHEKPFWVHFGAGNIFRAFQANVVQDVSSSRQYRRTCYLKIKRYC